MGVDMYCRCCRVESQARTTCWWQGTGPGHSVLAVHRMPFWGQFIVPSTHTRTFLRSPLPTTHSTTMYYYLCRCQTCPLLAESRAADASLPFVASGRLGRRLALASLQQHQGHPHLHFSGHMPLRPAPHRAACHLHAAARGKCHKRKCGAPRRGARFTDKPALRVPGVTTYAGCCKQCRITTGCLRFHVGPSGCAIYRTRAQARTVRAKRFTAAYRELGTCLAAPVVALASFSNFDCHGSVFLQMCWLLEHVACNV